VSTPDGRLIVHPMEVAHGLAPGTWEREHGADPAPRRARKPSMRRMIAAAEKIGKTLTSITHPDGTVLHFGELAPMQASKPWPLTDFTKVTKQ
jgi:hypothetical protein